MNAQMDFYFYILKKKKTPFFILELDVSDIFVFVFQLSYSLLKNKI